jgi:hypothetical protein
VSDRLGWLKFIRQNDSPLGALPIVWFVRHPLLPWVDRKASERIDSPTGSAASTGRRARMTVHGDKYVLDTGKSGHVRLQVISEIHDDRTRALLLDARLKAGDRFVEFGCGSATSRAGHPRWAPTRSVST